MSTKSLLINFAGYPISPRMLVPDNGLANLAGSLISRGHKTRILDYAVVSVIERLFPYSFKEEISEVTNKIMLSISNNRPVDYKLIDAFHNLDSKIDTFSKERVSSIASEVISEIRNFNADFVGMKLWMGDGFEGSIIIANMIKKEFPSLPVFAGGPHVDWFRENIFNVCSCFNALVYGEGENVILKLADYVQGKLNLEDISNLIYKENNRINITKREVIEDINSIVSPIYDTDVYPAMKGDEKIKIILLDESRGCPNNCSFCLHPAKSGNTWKTKDPEKIVDEMERVINKYGISAFRFAGSNTPIKLAKAVAGEIIKRNLKVDYVAFANTGNNITLDDYRLLKKSGCYALWFGVESGNQRILSQVMNKKIKVKQICSKLKNCQKAGIFVTASVIVPAPFEDENSKNDTFNLIKNTQPNSVIVDPPVLIPGTKWARDNDLYDIEIENKQEFINKIMVYKMKLLYPPILWKSMPEYKVNKKSIKEIFSETEEFSKRIENFGISTQITCDTALIAKYMDMHPGNFRDLARKVFICGDSEKIKNITKRVNENIAYSTACK